MTADALNILERRIGRDMAKMKHDIHLLNVKTDVNQKTTDENLDRGFQQIMEHLHRR